MKFKSVVCAFAAVVMSASAADTEIEEYDYDHWYVGAGGMLLLPQGGSDMRRLGGGIARFGYYLSESVSLEAEAAWMEDCAGLGVQGLWHVMGYERIDPFLTFGARGWIDGDVGPAAGLGLFYHLTDEWSLRFDGGMTLALDGGCDTVYTLSAGVQYSF